MASSQNGWPASADAKSIGVESFLVPGTELKLRVAKKVAPILINFAAEFNELVEKLEGKQLDDWGYAYRQVRGATDMLSNHASGTAIDLNATKHPLGAEGTFKPKQVEAVLELTDKYKLRWGGLYRNRKDEMHFEIIESPKQVKATIERLGLTL